MPYDASYVPPDDALVAAALQSVCSIPLAQRAYDALRSDPAAAALPDWIPASFAGPNGAEVFARRSEKTLRVGIDGLYTYAGFHGVVLDRLQDVAAQAALDRSVFAGGCPESADVSVSRLADDMLKLYYEDFIAQWDGFLHDVTLAPLTDLPTATENLKDLSSADSALKRLLTAVVAETDLARPEDAGRRPPRPAQGPLQGPRQARQARQARQEGREVHSRRRRRRRSTPAARRSPTISSRSGRRSPRSTAQPPALDAGGGGADRALERAADGLGQPRPGDRDQEPGRPGRADRRGGEPGGDPARPARRLDRRPRQRHHGDHRAGGGEEAQRHLAERRAALLQGGAAPAATPSTRTASTTSTPPTSSACSAPAA